MKILLLLPILFMLSCKKESFNDENKIANTTNVQNQIKIDGQLNIVRKNFTNFFTDIYTSAQFNNASGVYLLDTFCTNVGNVKLNNISMAEVPDINIHSYIDTTYQIPTLPIVLDIAGQSSFPQVQIQGIVNLFPIFTESSLIPDSIQKTNGVTITFSNIVNSDSVYISISRAGGYTEKFIKSFPVYNNNCTVAISPLDIAFLSAFQVADLYVYSTKTEYCTVSNLNFKVKYLDGHFKNVVLY